MGALKYIKPKKVSLKDHSVLNEKWVQEIIADDPSILGLGDLILKDKERLQPRAGRLDLLLQDSDSTRRYEVEIQLGKTDENHIIRTIEYWDIERKRYPQYEHCAVLVAEDITSRFLNVISLFNGFIPLIAIQMNALQMDENISLVFTTVLDQMTLGLVDEDEDVADATDRSYWEKRGTKATVSLVDDLIDIIKSFEPSIEPKYNKFYIGLSKEGQPNNFAIFHPKKKFVRIDLRLPKEEETETKIEEAGLDLMEYSRSGRTRIRLTKKEIKEKREFLTELIKMAYERIELSKL
jgi:predicted transport protein